MNNDNKQQRLDKLTAEYNDLNGKINRLDNFTNRLDFETIVPDSEEQMLMHHQLNAMRSYRTNLKERIQLLQAQIKAGSPCDDRVVTSAAHHCGQDAHDPCGELGTEGNPIPLPSPVGGDSAAVITGDSLKDLLGMEVISVGDMPCDACNPDNYAGRPCVKVELVGGTYLCLAQLPNSIITE